MKVRLPIIWEEKEPLDEDELLTLRALNESPKIVKEESSVIIETGEVSSWYSDKGKTILSMKNGRVYSIEIDELSFSVLWGELTNEGIKVIEYRRRKISNDERDIDRDEEDIDDIDQDEDDYGDI